MRKHILTAIGLLAITYPAQAQNVIPPEEYDHPFPGVVKLTRSSSQEEIKSKCPASIFPYHLGCGGKRADGSCAILMADDDTIKKHGWSVDIVFRHEQGHCNGWGVDHKGARPSTTAPKSPAPVPQSLFSAPASGSSPVRP
jgi:hypothetical protein